MLEHIEVKFKKWLEKLESFLKEMREHREQTTQQPHKRIRASFFDKKAEKIIDEYWEILQMVYDGDVLSEMEKQGYDPDIEKEIPKSVWEIIAPKLQPILTLISKDASDLLEVYKMEIDELDSENKTDLLLIRTATVDDALAMFNTIIKEK
jgi:hypothetical protein